MIIIHFPSLFTLLNAEGVFFRKYTKIEADRLRVHGFVKVTAICLARKFACLRWGFFLFYRCCSYNCCCFACSLVPAEHFKIGQLHTKALRRLQVEAAYCVSTLYKMLTPWP